MISFSYIHSCKSCYFIIACLTCLFQGNSLNNMKPQLVFTYVAHERSRTGIIVSKDYPIKVIQCMSFFLQLHSNNLKSILFNGGCQPILEFQRFGVSTTDVNLCEILLIIKIFKLLNQSRYKTYNILHYNYNSKHVTFSIRTSSYCKTGKGHGECVPL
jgi:hypothetical protein